MTTQEDIALREAYIQSCLSKGIQKSGDLHAFIEYSSGYKIPFKRVCPNHNTPWDYVDAVYFDKYPSLVVIANRDGGKTQDTGLLNYAELSTKPGIEIASVGAVQTQAKKCFQYTQEVFPRQACTDVLLEKDVKTELSTLLGSSFVQLVGTMSGANSPHPHRLRVDEVELIKWDLLEEMFMIPHAKVHPQSKQVLIPSNLVLISSMKQAGGNMAHLEKHHIEMGFHLMKWCWKETSTACPVDRRGDESSKVLTISTDLLTGIQKEVEVYEGCIECPLLHTCRGDAAEADGYIPVEENIKVFRQVSKDVWLNQKDARKAGSSLLVYRLDPEPGGKHVGDYPYNPNLPTVVLIDPGGRVPHAVLWMQYEHPRLGESLPNLYFIDEIYAAEKPDEWVCNEITETNKRLGVWPEAYIIDAAAYQFISNMQNAGLHNVRPAFKGTITEGIRRVESFLETAAGTVHIHIDKKCVSLIEEGLSYQYPNPYAVLPIDKDNHAWDAVRYGIVTLFGLVSIHSDGGAPRTTMPDGAAKLPSAIRYRNTPAVTKEYLPLHLK